MRRNIIATNLVCDIIQSLNEHLITTFEINVQAYDDSNIYLTMDSLTKESENEIIIRWSASGITIESQPIFRHVYGWDNVRAENLYWWLDVLSRAIYKIAKTSKQFAILLTSNNTKQAVQTAKELCFT